MKLLKGLFAIVLISMIAVSCSGEKKDADATKENIETVADKDIDATDSKMAAHVCDENCTKENCPMMKKMANHKCDENCKAGNCPIVMIKQKVFMKSLQKWKRKKKHYTQ